MVLRANSLLYIKGSFEGFGGQYGMPEIKPGVKVSVFPAVLYLWPLESRI